MNEDDEFYDTNTIWTDTPIAINESIFPIEHTLTVDGRAIIDGRDILKELDEMRDVLLLLKRDVDMEAKYPKLKELKDAYETHLEKYKTFEALK